jgi:DNA-binding phage protein
MISPSRIPAGKNQPGSTQRQLQANPSREQVEAQDFLLSLRQLVLARGGIQFLARETGLHRVNLNRMLSGKGNPELRSLLAIARVLGLKLRVEDARASEGEPRDAWKTSDQGGFPSPGIS